MNTASTPSLGDASSDNYYMTSSYYQGLSIQIQNVYTWASDVYQGQTKIPDWNSLYTQILYANLVLEGLNNVSVNSTTQQTLNSIRGGALFYRANAFFNLTQCFAPVFDSSSASTDLGIPLRLSSDINENSTRSNVKQSYDQILNDLSQSLNLVSSNLQILTKNRPSKPAVFALLSRIYLSMRNYVKAGLYADSCLQLYNTLNDYNTVKMSISNYLPYTSLNNNEVIFNSSQIVSNASPSGYILNALTGLSNQLGVDTLLYRSYAINDLRKSIFYYVFPNGLVNLNGSYAGAYNPFSGLATNEMYLIRAECNARAGNIVLAMSDLNTLLMKRWKTGTFVPLVAISASNAVSQILTERRKELPFSNVRWSDLRRLNKEGYNISLTRSINGQIYNLAPNDSRYTFPIPPDVIQLSGIQQNIR